MYCRVCSLDHDTVRVVVLAFLDGRLQLGRRMGVKLSFDGEHVNGASCTKSNRKIAHFPF